MKRIVCFLTALFLLLPLAGCSTPSFDPVLFYYCRKSEDYQYFDSEGIISSEGRDLTGHSKDLQYLVALYLAGPLDEDLISPFPRKTRLLEEEYQNDRIRIELTDLGNTMTDSEFSLASVCLAKTCMEYVSAKDVTIKSGARSITINSKNVVLFDTATPENIEGE